MSLGNIQRLIKLRRLKKTESPTPTKFDDVSLPEQTWSEWDATPVEPSSRIKQMLESKTKKKDLTPAVKWAKQQDNIGIERTPEGTRVVTPEMIARSKEGEMLEQVTSSPAELARALRAATKHKSMFRTKAESREYESLARELRGQITEDYARTHNYPKKVVNKLRTQARANKENTEGTILARSLLDASREKNIADLAISKDTTAFRQKYKQELYNHLQRLDPRQVDGEEIKEFLIDNIDDFSDYGLEAIAHTYSRGVKGISKYQPPKQTTALLGTGEQVLHRLLGDELADAPKREIQELAARIGSVIETPLEEMGVIKETRRKFDVGEKKAHPAQTIQITREPASKEFFDMIEQANPRSGGLMPSFTRPPVWKKSFQNGRSLIKSRDRDFVKTITQDNAKPLFESVNYLQSIPYLIDNETVSILRQLQARGKVVTPALDEAEMVRMSDIQKEMKVLDAVEEKTPEQLAALKTLQKEFAGLNKRYSKNYDETSTLDRAEAMGQVDRPFYYGVTLGDNGRIYYDFPLVNPQGSPIGRGVLRLGKGEVLTKEGVSTLKVEAASYIEDGANKIAKLSPEDRIAYFNQNEANFARWGNDPVNTFDEWAPMVDEKNRVAFINAIKDYAGWKQNPVGYKSHRITSMDATTSGAQIITALFDDDSIADLVNLIPNPKKVGDLYLHAGKATEDIIRKNAEAGSNIDRAALDAITDWKRMGKERTAFKRPLMVVPYGSGAKTIGETLVEDMANKGVFVDPEVARHIGRIMDEEMTKIIPALGAFKAIIKRMTSSIFDEVPMQEGQGYQTYAPRKPTISNELGFRYQHHYPHVAPDEAIQITHRDKKISLYPQKEYADVAGQLKGKAETAFMAKFIHFLDATLLQKLALKMKEKGLPLVPVHDQMGTSPNSANQMLDLIREVMKEMFGGKNKEGKRLLEQMIDEATDADGNLLWDSRDFEDLIRRGNLDIDETIDKARPFDFG